LQWSNLQFLILPVITLAMIPIGILARTTRAAVAAVRSQDFVQTLLAKGLSEWAATRHDLKNAMPQVMAVMGLQFGYLLGGSILVETVFTWPGSGFLLSKAIINRDVPVLQGTILVLSLVFVATNLVVDLLQSLIDPGSGEREAPDLPCNYRHSGAARRCGKTVSKADDDRHGRSRAAARGF
jgi:peptide/nickel transport system permease protein